MAPVYEYEAISRNGEKISGSLEVEDSYRLARQLKEQGYLVTSIKKKLGSRDIGGLIKFSSRVKTRDLALFSQQFAAMIDAGISLIDALDILERQIEHDRLKEVIRSIREDVETGSGLAESMTKHGDVFPDLYCQMVRAGESGGILDKVLIKLAAHYERQDEINGKIKSGLYYPLAILIIAVIVVIFLITSIVPQFVGIFQDLGGALPLPTRILLMLSGFIRHYWWLLAGGLGTAVMSLLWYRKTPAGELFFDRLIINIPVIGRMMKKIFLSRITNTLSVLLESGIDLLNGLAIIEDVVGNRIYAGILTETRLRVREGVTFSQPLMEKKEFPPMVVHMIKVGEESGSLEGMLKKVSNFYEREVEVSIDSTISLIEPALIVMMAVVVGFIVISIVTPMFDMYQYL